MLKIYPGYKKPCFAEIGPPTKLERADQFLQISNFLAEIGPPLS